MITTMNKLILLTVLLTAWGSNTLRGQILEYHFSGTVEGPHIDVDFFAEELELSDGMIQFGDQVSGTIWVDPVRGDRISGGDFPTNNRIYSGGLLDIDVQINGAPFLLSEGSVSMDIGIFGDVDAHPPGLEYPLGDDAADAVIFVSFVGIERVGHPEELFTFMVNLTDTTGGILGNAEYPDSIELEQYDLAKGFIRPWSSDRRSGDFGAMFQIDSFEFVGTRVRPVIAEGPQSQTVEAGESIRLTMVETRGNTGVECQWSLNGVDLPGETLPGLTLDDLQPSQAGTYRVTAWNSLGTTNVATARIEVEGLRHRLSPLELTGWNADVIVAPSEDLNQQDSFDRDAAFWFVAGYQDEPDGFPRSNRFTSAVNPSVRYQLQPYDANNVLWLTDSEGAGATGDSSPSRDLGHLTLHEEKKFTSLTVIAASSGGEGDEMASLILHFADGSKSEMIDFNAGDWWTVPGRSADAAIAGLGRMNQVADGEPMHDSPSGYGFGLYETELDLVALGLANKVIASIEFRKAASAAATGVFAVSGQSAKLHRGFYVSWPTEGDRELLEVAASPDGPWGRVISEPNTLGNRLLAMAEGDRMPRFSRSLLRSLDRELYAHYDFSRAGNDRLESGMSIEPGSNGEFVDGTLFVREATPDSTQPPLGISAVVPRLNYSRYTLALDFFPLEVDPDGKQTIVTGGRLHLWIQLHIDGGSLALSLDNDLIVETFENAEVQAKKWHRVICAVDTRTGIVDVMLDGKHLSTIELGERYRYQTNGASVHESLRSLVFGGAPDAAAFVGYVDNLMLFRSGLSPDNMALLHDALSPSPMVIDFGSVELSDEAFSVGMHVAWEGNLNGFEIQESGSPTGPWSSVEPLEALFNGRFLFPLEMTAGQAIYRLHNPF